MRSCAIEIRIILIGILVKCRGFDIFLDC